MKKTLLFSIICLFCIMIVSCNHNDVNIDNCSKVPVISAQAYASYPDDPLTIDSVAIVGNCLKITFSASGCSGSSWAVELVDSGYLLESYPPQRTLRLSLDNNELCQAYITKEATFNIRSLQTDGDRVLLNIGNYQILYTY